MPRKDLARADWIGSADHQTEGNRAGVRLSGLLLWSGRTWKTGSPGRMAKTRVEKTRFAEASSVDDKPVPRTLRCTKRRRDRCPAENSVAGKYHSARSISFAAGLGFPKQRLGPRRRNAQRVATSLTRRSNLSVTFAGHIGNARRGIRPLHCTGMFPGSTTPEEWIKGHTETETSGSQIQDCRQPVRRF